VVPCNRRLLTVSPDKLGKNLAQVRALLLAVGLSEKQISALVLRCPRAMLHNPVLLAVKLAGFKVGCKLCGGTRQVIMVLCP
jgi:hypothetical protein